MDQEELDYDGEEEYGEKKNMAISALAEEEMMPEDDEYEDLYNDVNVGEGFMESVDNNNNNNNNNNTTTDVDTNPVAPLPEQNEAEAEAEAEADSAEVNKGLKIEDVKDGEEVVGEKEGFSGVKEELGFDASEGQNPHPVNPRVSEKNGDFVASRPVAAKPSTPEVSKPVEPRAPNRVNNNHQNRGGGGSINENSSRTNEGGGATMLFVGDLHWWTTDAEIEAELNKYGRVKELKFYDEKASGKSKGYCHVEFYDPSAAAACKQGMHNHSFNGRNCVVEFANANGVRQMGAAQVSKQQLQVNQGQSQQRRTGNEGGGGGGGNRGMGNYQGGSGDSGRNYNKMGNWGRSGQGGGGNRGQGGQGRGRGMGGKNMGGGGSGGGPYGQGLPGPPMGAPPGGLMHPQGLMGQGFDPAYGAHMGRGGGYGGFSSHGPFPGMIPPFPPVGTVGLPGVAPHVNPAFFGRGVAANGMAMMPNGGMDGQMWGDSSMGGGGWNNEEQHGRRMRESSYGDDMSSDYGYNDMGHDRAGRSSGTRDKDRGGSERDWGGSSDRRRRDDRDGDWHRDRYRDDKEGYSDRQRDRDWDNEEDWDREKPSKGRSKSRMMDDDDQRPRSKDVEYNKRRRMPSDHE